MHSSGKRRSIMARSSSVTRDIPAASVAALLLNRKALRRVRSCVPKACSWAALCLSGRAGGRHVFLMLFNIDILSVVSG